MNVRDGGVPVEELLDAVRKAVRQANMADTDLDRDLRVTSVRLVLQVVATTAGGFGVSFTVPFIGFDVKLGTRHTRENTHTVDVTLVPQDAADRHEVRDATLDRTLVEAITTIRRIVAYAGSGDDPFVLSDGSVELIFAVTEEGTIALGLDGQLTDALTHTLHVRVGRPS